ncbi:MAG: hypothetical protein AB8B99_05040 [Phormidesmis sp.]
MAKWNKTAAVVGINLLFTVGLIEVALRFFPTVVPANLLIHFEPNLRSKLAAGRFPTAEDAVVFERTDGGFPFPIWKPMAEISYSFEDPGTVNTVKMDEIGFCNVPNLYSQQTQFDVVAIGDSFTWCTTVRPEDTWPAQLAEVTDVSAYNLGKPGIGLYEYLALLKRFGLEKKPKVVVMNVYEGNDLRDALKFVSYRQSGATDQRTDNKTENQQPEEKSFGPLGRTSYAWNLFRAVIVKNKPTQEQTEFNFEGYFEDDENFRYTLNFESGALPFNLENGDLDEVVHAKLLTDGKVDLSIFADALTQFVQLSESEGFIPILTYTPSAYTVYADVVDFEQSILNDIMPDYSQQQRDFFAAKSNELGIAFLDFTPGLRAASKDYTTPEKILYYQTNRHFTKFGHAVVADLLVDTIEAKMTESP